MISVKIHYKNEIIRLKIERSELNKLIELFKNVSDIKII